MANEPPFGYHIDIIPKGVVGEVSKITEEYLEFMDAHKQGVVLMQLVELSDLFGAISAWLKKYHPNVSLSDLEAMSRVTQRAFKNGHRAPSNGINIDIPLCSACGNPHLGMC